MIKNPTEHLQAAGTIYPNAWNQIDIFRDGRGKDLPMWPNWCFLPFAAWYAIVSEGKTLAPSQVADVARLAAFGTWRYTQGIYRFDPQVYEELIATNIKGDIPSEVLLRLPEWCMYIETPNYEYVDGEEIYGFWVQLEWDTQTERVELRLLLNMKNSLLPMILHIGEWTLEEAVAKALNESKIQAQHQGIPTPPLNSAISKRLATFLSPLVSLVLFLCSDEPEIEDRKQPSSLPQRPRPKRTKKGWKLFPAKRPRTWNVADNLGEKIRVARKLTTRAQIGGRKGPIPHLRKSHWHGFWKGPRDGKRKFIIKWLGPIVVSGEKQEENK